ncbi:MAG: hypothetical protein KF781_08790 [Chitinophagaceae bacterium]|nr:hypothetical protein [Chitinophagaceae bacterium]MCW5905089.1 hypothetical protein [Chitinophagaceae bacterium]
MVDKLQEYKDRQKEWRNISISQLSTVNNVLLTLSSGLFVFCIDKKKVSEIHFNFCHSINWQVASYWVSVLILGISIFFGLGVLFSRLYDFRISRHISLTRLRFYKEYKNADKKELPYNDFGKFKTSDRVQALFNCIFCELPFINSDDAKKVLENDKVKTDFQNLRKTADILGSITWKWTKIQIGLFLVSGIIYLLHQLTL